MNFRKIIITFLVIIFIIQEYLLISSNASQQSECIKVVLDDDVYNPNLINNESLSNNNDEIKIYSESAILIEEKTGKILYEKDIHTKKFPASTTKILTAIIALEKCNLNEKAIASYEAINSVKSGYSTANIQVGEAFSIEQLLNVLMLQSANEAANIIAEHISGSVSEFAKLMNQKAKEIGCLNSNFVNANGTHDDNHYSTTYDLALIARYCMKNDKFRSIVTNMECSLPTTELWQEERKFRNTNSLLQSENRYYYQYCNGIKTGFTTPAKNCLVSSSNKNGFETIAVVLHAEATEDGLSARYLDTINLFEYGYNNYDINEILEEYDMIGTYEESNDNCKNTQELIIGSTVKKESEENIVYSKNENQWISVSIIQIIVGLLIILFVITFLSLKYKKRKLICE